MQNISLQQNNGASERQQLVAGCRVLVELSDCTLAAQLVEQVGAEVFPHSLCFAAICDALQDFKVPFAPLEGRVGVRSAFAWMLLPQTCSGAYHLHDAPHCSSLPPLTHSAKVLLS